MSRRLFLTLLIPAAILLTTIIVVLLGRGYRLDLKKKEVKPTGILVATSNPNGAQVFLNGKFAAATNSNINLSPGWYEVRIHKEGYQDWRKKIPIRGEVVVKTDAVLFPANPALSPLTTTGIQNPILSPDGTKIAYLATPSAFLEKQNPNSASRRGASQRTPSAGSRAAAQAPQGQAVYILDLTSRPLLFNKNPRPYPGTLNQLLAQWRLEAEELRWRRLRILPKEFAQIATTSAQILSFSPDESKVLYQATASATLAQVIKPPLIGTNPTPQTRQLKPNKIYVYDLKEDRNYSIMEVGKNLFWLPTNRHLVLIEENKISILEYDGTNKVTIYSGPFENSYVFPHPEGHSLIILTTLNPAASSLPNLYSLSLM